MRPTAGGTSYGHSGFFPGYGTDLQYFPAERVAIAVQLNTSDQGRSTPRPGQVIQAMLRAVRAAGVGGGGAGG